MAEPIVTIKAFEGTRTHFVHPNGEYATICGMDGDDDNEAVMQETIDTPKGAKVDCEHCIAIFDQCKKYSERNIDRSKKGKADY